MLPSGTFHGPTQHAAHSHCPEPARAKEVKAAKAALGTAWKRQDRPAAPGRAPEKVQTSVCPSVPLPPPSARPDHATPVGPAGTQCRVWTRQGPGLGACPPPPPGPAVQPQPWGGSRRGRGRPLLPAQAKSRPLPEPHSGPSSPQSPGGLWVTAQSHRCLPGSTSPAAFSGRTSDRRSREDGPGMWAGGTSGRVVHAHPRLLRG